MMMRKTKLWVALGFFLSACGSVVMTESALADTAQAEAQKAIRAIYDKRSAAIAEFDAEGAWSNHANGYISITTKGERITAAQSKENLQTLLDVAESISSHTIMQKITLKGDTATVLIRDSATVVFPDPKSEDKKGVFKATERAVDTWVKRKGLWLHTQNKTLSSFVTVNGKQIKE